MLMHERLNEQGGMSLALRFVMYVDFLVQCVRLLSRSPTYDPTTLELLRLRILRLRALRGIPGMFSRDIFRFIFSAYCIASHRLASHRIALRSVIFFSFFLIMSR